MPGPKAIATQARPPGCNGQVSCIYVAKRCVCALFFDQPGKITDFKWIHRMGAIGLNNNEDLGEVACSDVISELLGTPTRSKRCVNDVFPKEVEFVAMAFSCDHGPLSKYIVMSRLSEDGEIYPQPAMLSLLPRSSNAWVKSVLSDCCQTSLLEATLTDTRCVHF